MRGDKFIILLAVLFLSACNTNKTAIEQLYVQRMSGNRCAYTDVYDKTVIAGPFQDARQFSNHLAAVKKDSQWGYINENGEFVIPCKYEWVSSYGEFGFDKDLAIAKNNCEDLYVQQMFHPAQTFLLDKNGHEIAEYGYVSIVEKGLSRVNNGKKFDRTHSEYLQSDGYWGCVNAKGQEVIPCQFELMSRFSGEISFVMKGGKWGCINKNGKLVVPCQYEDLIYTKGSDINCSTFSIIKHQEENPYHITLSPNCLYLFYGKQATIYSYDGKRLKLIKHF